uniref:hypothetical protein n=1 Tax=uncultured Altererythrobacter sp. TaxID=500840 RepID=UPI00260530D1|nr:hypothetical protein [uncultured Altererythrobacter sp.]
MISMVLAAAISAAPITCSPLPGWETIAEAVDGKFLVLGESHGTVEAPRALAEYVCAASENRSILVAIEFTSTSNDDFQRAWEMPHTEFADALRSKVPDWNGREDGVASQAMLEMLVRLHALKTVGRDIAIVAFNGAKNDAQRDKFAHLPGQEPHEAAQAENIRDGWVAGAYHQTVVLVGGLHATKTVIDLNGINIRPMANQIASPEDVISLRMVHEGGESWSCQLRADIDFDPTRPVTTDMLSCQPHSARGWAESPEPGFYLAYSPDEAAFDGVFSLGPISASPPAVPKKD